MGQRLVCTIKKGGKELAAIYYHWSAYTMSALFHTQGIVNCIYDHNDETDSMLKLRLVRYCEANDGGITGGDANEHEYIRGLYPNEKFKDDGYSRNCGLIALSETGINHLQSWSEGDVVIDLDDDMISFGVCGWYESFDEYVEERREWDDEFESMPLNEIPDIGCDLGEFSVDDIGDVISAMEAVNANPVRYGNEIFELIE